MRLAKEGFWGGDPGKVLQADADMVLAAMQYVIFGAQYERKYFELNTKKD